MIMYQPMYRYEMRDLVQEAITTNAWPSQISATISYILSVTIT